MAKLIIAAVLCFMIAYASADLAFCTYCTVGSCSGNQECVSIPLNSCTNKVSTSGSCGSSSTTGSSSGDTGYYKASVSGNTYSLGVYIDSSCQNGLATTGACGSCNATAGFPSTYVNCNSAASFGYSVIAIVALAVVAALF